MFSSLSQNSAACQFKKTPNKNGGFCLTMKGRKMKKSVLLAVCGVLGVYANNGLAVDAVTWGPGTSSLGAGCYSWNCYVPDAWYYSASPTSRNCADYTAMCVYLSGTVTGVASCMTCNPGYELAKTTAGITACSQSGDPSEDSGGINSYTYTYCTKNCSTSNCAPTAWSAKGTGYETRTNRSCSTTGTSGTCNTSTQYRCAAGYYGSSSNGTSGCAQCAEAPSVYTNSARTTKARGTSSAGTASQNGCYLVAGTYYDVSGTFTVSGTSCTY